MMVGQLPMADIAMEHVRGLREILTFHLSELQPQLSKA
jgi:hypothetical protein